MACVSSPSPGCCLESLRGFLVVLLSRARFRGGCLGKPVGDLARRVARSPAVYPTVTAETCVRSAIMQPNKKAPGTDIRPNTRDGCSVCRPYEFNTTHPNSSQKKNTDLHHIAHTGAGRCKLSLICRECGARRFVVAYTTVDLTTI